MQSSLIFILTSSHILLTLLHSHSHPLPLPLHPFIPHPHPHPPTHAGCGQAQDLCWILDPGAECRGVQRGGRGPPGLWALGGAVWVCGLLQGLVRAALGCVWEGGGGRGGGGKGGPGAEAEASCHFLHLRRCEANKSAGQGRGMVAWPSAELRNTHTHTCRAADDVLLPVPLSPSTCTHTQGGGCVVPHLPAGRLQRPARVQGAAGIPAGQQHGRQPGPARRHAAGGGNLPEGVML